MKPTGRLCREHGLWMGLDMDDCSQVDKGFGVSIQVACGGLVEAFKMVETPKGLVQYGTSSIGKLVLTTLCLMTQIFSQPCPTILTLFYEFKKYKK